MRREHTFDWKGFLFVGAITGSVTLTAALLYIGTPILYSYYAPLPAVEPELSVAQAQSAPLPLGVWSIASSSERIISSLTLTEAVPLEGKFITADLVRMELTLYIDGKATEQFPILTKGKPGTPWETPAGFYSIFTKEDDHFSSLGKVHMPYSMQFFGNYFIHGWPYYPDGTPVASTFSGGCIRLSTDDAKKVFEFADKKTGIFVYDKREVADLPSLFLPLTQPEVDAPSYLVADIDTGEVYAEKDAELEYPIASITKLMTGLVANEIINLEQQVPVEKAQLTTPPTEDTTTIKFLVGDLFYPLLLESNDTVADALARYYSKNSFVSWMNTTAKALGMASTHFADPVGSTDENISTSEDLYRFIVYLIEKKKFILNVSKTANKTITAQNGDEFEFWNRNAFSASSTYMGGASKDGVGLSIFSFKAGGVERRVAIVVLGSKAELNDTSALAEWISSSAKAGQGACAACAFPPSYRKIEL